MKITASRRDDILRRKSAYEQEYQDRKARHDAQEKNYRLAEEAMEDGIIQVIQDKLGNLAEGLSIRITYRFRNIAVDVDNETEKGNEDVSLRWNWTVYLDKDGNIVKDSGSWSGLQAVTSEQIRHLRHCIDQIEALNNIDWVEILQVEVPKYSEYVTEDNPAYDRDKPNFDKELLEADVEECIGKDLLIADKNGKIYYLLIGETPTQYKIKEYGNYNNMIIDYEGFLKKYRENGGTNTYPGTLAEYIATNGYDYRMKKDKFLDLIKNPVTVIEF